MGETNDGIYPVRGGLANDGLPASLTNWDRRAVKGTSLLPGPELWLVRVRVR